MSAWLRPDCGNAPSTLSILMASDGRVRFGEPSAGSTVRGNVGGGGAAVVVEVGGGGDGDAAAGFFDLPHAGSRASPMRTTTAVAANPGRLERTVYEVG